MNTGNVISLPVAASLAGKEYETVKLTSTGVDIAGQYDQIIGTVLRGNQTNEGANLSTAVGMAADILLSAGNSVAFAKCGNATAIAMGDKLEQDSTSGRLVKWVGGKVVGVAVDALAASSDGGVFRAILFPAGAVQNLVAVETVTAARTLTVAESGKTIFLNSATEFDMILPAKAAGLHYRFIIANGGAPSGASYTVTATDTDTIYGGVYSSDLNAASDADFEATGGGDVVTFVDSKAVAGDSADFWCDGTSWYVRAFCSVFDAITITG
jgi:hypothetical protein